MGHTVTPLNWPVADGEADLGRLFGVGLLLGLGEIELTRPRPGWVVGAVRA